MKKILIAVGILVGLVIVVAIAAPFFIPVETYKSQVEQRIEAATGRKLTIAGPVKVSLLPSVAIVAKDVHFANAPGFSTSDMATLAGLELKLKVLPLLSGEVAIDSFVLDKPVINFEVNKQGRPNWQFDTAARQSAQPDQPQAAAGKGGGGGLQELRLDTVRLNDGRITYRDEQSGANYAAEAINVRLSLPDLDSPFRADGGLTWNGKPVKLRVDLANPRAMMAGKPSALALDVDADLLRLDFKGTASNGAPLKVDGSVDLNAPNLRRLAAWVGQPLTAPGSGLGPFEIKGQFAMAGPKVNFTGAELSLDAIRARGDVMVDTSGNTPYVKATLDTNMLDLNPYLPPAATQRTSDPKPASATETAAPITQTNEGWSTEPIDLAGLRAANADLSLTIEGLLIRKIKLGQGRMDVQIKDGTLAADLVELALYQGSGKGRVTLDGAGKVPAVGLDMTLTGVQAEPLLKDVMDMDRLIGTAEGQVQISGAGVSQDAMMRSLDGKGGVKFENGAIKGVNLAAMVRNVASAFLDAQAGRAEQTDFSELSGSYVIDKGILKNNDLILQAPLLRLSGTGTVNLPERSLSYRVEPKVAATLEGQGGRQDARGLAIPVVISGPWDKLSYKPDVSSLLDNPQGVVEGLRGILGGQKAPTGGSTGGTDTGSGGGQSAPSNPMDQLRGIFGR